MVALVPGPCLDLSVPRTHVASDRQVEYRENKTRKGQPNEVCSRNGLTGYFYVNEINSHHVVIPLQFCSLIIL
jgi:hypothetical protein